MDERFRGFKQLVGDHMFDRVARASVCVIGVGGVGSWAVEALARSGVGSLTLVDLDEVCVTNVNRQVQALDGAIGSPKVDVLAARVSAIHPECRVVPVQRFFTARTADEILAEPYDVVLDCIDRLSNKVHLIASCVAAKKRIVTVGSAGDRMDPTMVRVCDLARTQYDNLLAVVRKRLRQRHGFSRSERARFGVPCVYIPLQKEERPDSSEFAAPVVCAEPLTGEGRRSCNDGLGTAGFVTGAMGFVAAAEVIKVITADR